MIEKWNSVRIACETIDDNKNVVIASKGLRKKAIASDNVDRDTVFSPPTAIGCSPVLGLRPRRTKRSQVKQHAT